jgi:hypothetical protein
MDWRGAAEQQWRMRVETADGRVIELDAGGARLRIDGAEQAVAGRGEYREIYARFADLVAGRASEVDREPLRIVADAYLVGQREPTEAFS